MSKVIIKGSFMKAYPKVFNFNGELKTAVYIDIYQPDSKSNEKLVSIKTDDITLLEDLNNDYTMGSIFESEVSLSVYQNKVYYKLLDIIA